MESEGGASSEGVEGCSVCRASFMVPCLSRANEHKCSTTSQRVSFAFLVDSAIESASSAPMSTIQTSQSSSEDSDSWLEVAPDELDGMMMRASGRDAPAANGDAEQRPAELGEKHGEALQDLAKKVEQFVGGQGDLEGARFEE